MSMTVEGFPRSVTVFGTGLIGSSFALALKKCAPGIRVYGVDNAETLGRARSLSIVESGEPQDSELLILAAPVGGILQLIDSLPSGPALVLDVGSTKAEICNRAERRNLPFIGGHPMTGSEKSGPDAASPDLFQSAPFFLCPISSTPEYARPLLKRIVEAIGGHPVFINADEHDKLVAQISHLPQILSTLLADQTSNYAGFAGPGWKSMARLAGSPFHVWRDILSTSGSLPSELRTFIDRLKSVLDALEAGNSEELERMFKHANRAVSEDCRE
jgi:prephenate dehydrogenase